MITGADKGFYVGAPTSRAPKYNFTKEKSSNFGQWGSLFLQTGAPEKFEGDYKV